MREPYSPAVVETRTREWLTASLDQGVAALPDPADGVYGPNGAPQHMSRYHFQALQRQLEIFRWLERFRFGSFIDVGSGWGSYPHLVARRYGTRVYYSDFVHRMNLPLGGDGHGRLDHAVTLNASRLPFPDAAFDVVLSSEVLEHLVRPVEAIAELKRITRKHLVLTSLEALSPSRRQRAWSQYRVDVRTPHVERNFLLLEEFEALFGTDVHHESLLYDPALPASSFGDPERQAAAYAGLRDVASLTAALCRAVAERAHRPGSMGILLVWTRPGAGPPRSEPGDDAALARWLIAENTSLEREVFAILRRIGDGAPALPARERPVAAALLAEVRCPDCGGTLSAAGSGAQCDGCSVRFDGEYGVPILFTRRAAEGAAAEEVCLARLCGDDAGRQRVVRRLMRRLRRNEAPPSALRRAVWSLAEVLSRRPVA